VRKLLDTPQYGCKAVNLGELRVAPAVWLPGAQALALCCVVA
jgi:hypothetical protein